MVMRTKIAQLNEQNSLFEQSVAQADANWNDSVKAKFFNERIEPMRNEYQTFLSAMENTAATFESAERTINSLM